ncbi:MAG: ATP-binding protein, partial [Alphaproteobacteria bacterium]|nr:ATP-binding protein [Alphaproteobacteria bacterium]
DLQRLDLVDVARDALVVVQPRADMRGIHLRAAFPDAAVSAVGDRRALSQVVSSLIDNAIKYSQPGAQVDVSVAASPQRTASLIVSDKGIGMSAEEVRNIFKPFWQSADVYTRDHTGLGLGLAVTQKLVQAMGGEVLVESAAGEGSRFTVLLPAAA